MREIKFRVWEKPAVLLQGKDEGTKVFEGRMWTDNDPKFWAYCLMNERDEYELLQYTGLKDKNGKEIYEGDILVTWINVTEELNLGFEIRKGFRVISTWIIKWSENTPSWCIEQVLIDGSRMESGMISNEYLTNFEIIGNIYENPELLSNTSKS